MAKTTKITTPTSSTGIIRFYDTETGGPKFDPRVLVAFTVGFIVFIFVVGALLNKGILRI
ncbi:MAG: preprotein translocase subunit Sec61beta [Candidatus Micrarchaeia archaeon]